MDLLNNTWMLSDATITMGSSVPTILNTVTSSTINSISLTYPLDSIGSMGTNTTDNNTIFDPSEEPLEREYFGEFFLQLNHLYRPVHGTLSLLICFFGAVTNILNIIVLTR